MCYKIEYIVLDLPILPAAEVARACLRRPEIEFNELDFWACKPSSLNSVCKPRNRVHWTRFQGLQTESKELGLQAQKPSSLNSVCKPRNRVLCTRFHLSPRVHHRTHSKNFLRLKNTQFQKTQSLTLIPSHSQSLSHSHSPLSLSLSLTLTLLLHRRLAQSLIPSHSSRSVAVAVAVAASRSRPSVSASLNLSPSMVGSNYLTKVRTLFFLGLLVMDDWHALIDFF